MALAPNTAFHPMACPRLVSFGSSVRSRLRPMFTTVCMRTESSDASRAAGVPPSGAAETKDDLGNPTLPTTSFPQGVSAADGGFFNRRALRGDGQSSTRRGTLASPGQTRTSTSQADSSSTRGRDLQRPEEAVVNSTKKSASGRPQGWWAEAVASSTPGSSSSAAAESERSFPERNDQKPLPAYELKRQVASSRAASRTSGSRSAPTQTSVRRKFSKDNLASAAGLPTSTPSSESRSRANTSNDTMAFPSDPAVGRSPLPRSRPPPASELFRGRPATPPPSRPLPTPPWERKLRPKQADQSPSSYPAWIEDASRDPAGPPAGDPPPARTRRWRREGTPVAPPSDAVNDRMRAEEGIREAPAGTRRSAVDDGDRVGGSAGRRLEDAYEAEGVWGAGSGRFRVSREEEEEASTSEEEGGDGFLKDWYGRGPPPALPRLEVRDQPEEGEVAKIGGTSGVSYDSWSMGVQPAWRDEEGGTGSQSKIKPRPQGEDPESRPWKFQGLYEGPDGLLYRQPYHDPFGPETTPRPWTGKRPIVRKKKPDDFDSFNPPPRKKGIKQVTKPGPFLKGTGPEDAATKTDVMGEPLTPEEVNELVTKAQKQAKQVNIGRDGLVHNLVDVIHNHWKRNRVARIKAKGVPTVDMHGLHQEIEEKTGGKIIWSNGGVMFLFRGRFYNFKTRPEIKIMLWKPPTPVFPPLVPPSPGGLSPEDAARYIRVGKELRPLCKLNKNGVYMNLVRDVREGFAVSVLLRIDMTVLEKGDYTKITAKLKHMVPCIPLSLHRGDIILWRGREWPPPSSVDGVATSVDVQGGPSLEETNNDDDGYDARNQGGEPLELGDDGGETSAVDDGYPAMANANSEEVEDGRDGELKRKTIAASSTEDMK